MLVAWVGRDTCTQFTMLQSDFISNEEFIGQSLPKKNICTGRESCRGAVGSSSVGRETAVLGGTRNRYTCACHHTDAELALAASLYAYMACLCVHLLQ